MRKVQLLLDQPAECEQLGLLPGAATISIRIQDNSIPT